MATNRDPYGVVLSSPTIISRDKLAEQCGLTPAEVDAKLRAAVQRGDLTRAASEDGSRAYYKHRPASLHGR